MKRRLTSFLAAARKRIHDTHGFTLAEQLFAVVLIGLLGLVTTAGIGAAMNVYNNITMQTHADSLLTRAAQTVSDELAFSLAATDKDGGSTVSDAFDSATTFSNVQLTANSDGSLILDYVNSEKSQIIVAAPEDENLQLAISFNDGGYELNSNIWKYTISVKRGDRTLAQQEDVIVKRVNPATPEAATTTS